MLYSVYNKVIHAIICASVNVYIIKINVLNKTFVNSCIQRRTKKHDIQAIKDIYIFIKTR